MGDAAGCADEQPLAKVKIEKPFWIGTCEVTNAQFALFDPGHDSAYISVYNKDQANRGEPVNRPRTAGRPRLVAAGDGLLPLALAEDGPEVSRCPPRPNGNTPAAPAPTRRWTTATCKADFGKFANLADAERLPDSAVAIRRKWIPASPRSTTAPSSPRTWANICPTPGACTTCTATWPSGLARPIALSLRRGRRPRRPGGRGHEGGPRRLVLRSPPAGKQRLPPALSPWQRVYQRRLPRGDRSRMTSGDGRNRSPVLGARAC